MGKLGDRTRGGLKVQFSEPAPTRSIPEISRSEASSPTRSSRHRPVKPITPFQSQQSQPHLSSAIPPNSALQEILGMHGMEDTSKVGTLDTHSGGMWDEGFPRAPPQKEIVEDTHS